MYVCIFLLYFRSFPYISLINQLFPNTPAIQSLRQPQTLTRYRLKQKMPPEAAKGMDEWVRAIE